MQHIITKVKQYFSELLLNLINLEAEDRTTKPKKATQNVEVSNFYVGQRVTSLEFGEGTVIEVYVFGTFPVRVIFDNFKAHGSYGYRLNGQYYIYQADTALDIIPLR